MYEVGSISQYGIESLCVEKYEAFEAAKKEKKTRTRKH